MRKVLGSIPSSSTDHVEARVAIRAILFFFWWSTLRSGSGVVAYGYDINRHVPGPTMFKGVEINN